MGTIADKLTYLAETKEAIKDKINELGGGMPDETPFRLYPDYITGGSPTPPTPTGSGAVAQFIWVDEATGHTRVEKVRAVDGKVSYPDDWYEGDIAAKTVAESGDWETPAITYAETLYTYGGAFISKEEAEAAMQDLRGDLTISTKHLFGGDPKVGYACVYLNLDLVVTLSSTLSITQVDWGDGTVDSTSTHTYAAKGAYTIKITPVWTSWVNSIISASTLDVTAYKLRRLYLGGTILQAARGNRGLIDFFTPGSTGLSYRDCWSLVNVSPIVTGNTTAGMFYYCYNFNQPVTMPASVVDTNNMFCYCYNFNQPITIPDGVTSTSSMFYYCCNFNQPVTIPDKVTTTSSMFGNCYAFNQPVTIPDKVTTTSSMFGGCYAMQSDLTMMQTPTSYNYELGNGTGFHISKIKVPTANLEAWKTAWPDWAGLFEEIE
jgi:hypothetical protein